MEPTVTIKNSQTGEVKQIPQSQLAAYGLAPTTQTPAPAQGGGLWPLLGSIGGSLLGLPFGPLGVSIGGAIGGGGAAALTGGNVGKEALLGGIGGLLPIGRLGRIVGAGARAAEEAGVQTAERAGTGLAAKTLASNFIVPTKSGRAGINIEDALHQAIQDRTIPGPLNMERYKTLSNDIVGAITKGRQFVANNIQTPINYEQPLSDAVSFSKQLGEIEKDTIPTIRGFLNTRAPIGVGAISATDAHDVAQQLENEGYNLIKAYGPKAITPNLAKANKGDVMVGVAQDLRAQIDRATQTEGFLDPMKQQIIEQLGGKYPNIEAKIQQATSVPEIRSIAAPYVNISKAVDSTIIAHQAPMGKAGEQLGLRLAGAGAGFGIGHIPGAIAGAMVAPAAAGIGQAAQPALTSLAAKGILGGAGAASKFGPTVLGQVGAHALGGIAQPTEAQAKEPETTNNLFPQETKTQKPQDILRQRLGILSLSKAKNVSDLVAAYNLLYPKPAALPQEFLRAQTGIDVINSLKQIPQQTLNKTGTAQAATVHAKLNLPKGLGRYFISKGENDLASLESQYFLLTQGVLTAIQGSRPSDYDAKVYQNFAGPSIQFPNYVNQQRVQNFLNLLQAKINQTTPATIPFPQGGQ